MEAEGLATGSLIHFPVLCVLSACFIGFVFIFVSVSRMRSWCMCEVCRSYLTSEWRKEFHNICDWHAELLRRSPTGAVGIHILGCTITANPVNVEHILKNKFDNYRKGKLFSTILGDLLGRGIFNVDGDRWIFQRKLASAELGGVSVKSHAIEVLRGEIEERMLPFLDSAAGAASHVNLQDVFRRFAFGFICRFSFGLELDHVELGLPLSEFAAAFDAACEISAKRATLVSPMMWKMKRVLNLGSEKELRRAIQVVKGLAETLIQARRKTAAGGGRDLLSQFMNSVTDEEFLRDIVINFLLAGRDTVTSGLTSLFWWLVRNPAVQGEIREEISRVMTGGESAPSLEQLGRMTYLHAAMHESLRLHPPVQFDSKFAMQDDVLPDGTFIRRGSRVTYHPYSMGRMQNIWGVDCLQFKPERWLKDGKFSPASPFKYPVFQAGPRACLGKEIALLEMGSVTVAVLRRFRLVALNPDSPAIFSHGLTSTLHGGLPVLLHRLPSLAPFSPHTL